MEVVKIDSQGRIIIPKSLREKKGLNDEVEILEMEEGIILRPKKDKSWDEILSKKIKVDWSNALTVSLESLSIDDIILG
ncbi:MAG: AbrB/MazE/SpoVT family DNA-binding domain-containing protein [archaeon]|nr:AbrB/MazE/SpoVT family DNA-binding domain-containing protein [archaeon]MCP8317182.1 AbrB/MazE/SpoVT family DNA-binding domain-containing protein [archaeon]MCP8322434.1 AbrB/MazE/SpoVT family DNA-binding domain-containing protein [archaeon]